MNNNKFEIGKTYFMSFIGDSQLKPKFECIGKTEKTAKFQRVGCTEQISRRIKIYDGNEYVLEGSYSMAPSINARNVIK